VANDDYTDEEREVIAKLRDKRKAEQSKADADKRVWIRNSAGEEADVPYDKGRGWLQRTFGIDLDEEPVQDETGDDDSKPPRSKAPTVAAFGSGSRRRQAG